MTAQAIAPIDLGSHLETMFATLWVDQWPSIDLHTQWSDVPLWEIDYRNRTALKPRSKRYKADFAHPESRLLIEIDGSVWQKGGHNSGSGRMRDCRKDALAVLSGWRVIRLAGEDMVTTEYVQAIGESILGVLSASSVELLAEVA